MHVVSSLTPLGQNRQVHQAVAAVLMLFFYHFFLFSCYPRANPNISVSSPLISLISLYASPSWPCASSLKFHPSLSSLGSYVLSFASHCLLFLLLHPHTAPILSVLPFIHFFALMAATLETWISCQDSKCSFRPTHQHIHTFSQGLTEVKPERGAEVLTPLNTEK